MDDFRLAVKAFVVDGGDLLVLHRIPDDVQAPSIWELPGGRLEPGEDPFRGLRREVREETGLDVEPLEPLTVRHFTRDDGQTVTMIVFSCETEGRALDIRPEEHDEARWVSLDEAEETLDQFFQQELQRYSSRFRDR